MSECMIEKFKNGARLRGDNKICIEFVYDASDIVEKQYLVECVEQGNTSVLIGSKWLATEDNLQRYFKLIKKKVWVNFYSESKVSSCIELASHDTKEAAEASAGGDCIFTAMIEVDE